MISVPIWLFVLLAIPTAFIIVLLIVVIVQAIVITIQEKNYRRKNDVKRNQRII